MPQNNKFRHQRYSADAPATEWQLLGSPPQMDVDSDAGRQVMRDVGKALRKTGVRAIYLVHGTFVGDDALGFLRNLSHVFPAAADVLRRLQKEAFDKITGDAGNYTDALRVLFETAINADAPDSQAIPVRLFRWSSENLHIARAHGAVALIDDIASLGLSPSDRVLLWGHSHGGNVFALATNLIAASQPVRQRFFRACRSYFRSIKSKRLDFPVWQSIEEKLDNGLASRLPQLDLVTFGTPIRYGWDSDGYSRLLHFVYHRPCNSLPPYRTAFPPTVDHFFHATGGDYVQHLGVAGTNLTPYIFAWRTWLAEIRLGRFIQRHVRSRDLLARLKCGVRVPDEGETLLVDYGILPDQITRHHAGHAVYTFRRWLVFHAAEIARRFYGLEADSAR